MAPLSQLRYAIPLVNFRLSSRFSGDHYLFSGNQAKGRTLLVPPLLALERESFTIRFLFA
jgi:hypothetical protein